MNQLKKPEILSVSLVAKSRIFEIQSIDLRFSNGEQRTYERFKPATRSGVMILPVENDELIMVREYAMGTEQYEPGFPKGLLEPGETPQQGANRELKEEVGLGARCFKHLRTVNSNLTFMNAPMHIFIAQDFYPCKLPGDEPEPLLIERIPLTEIDELLNNPEFCDSRNLVALYALRDWLKNREDNGR